MHLVYPDSLERPVSSLQTTNSQQHTWPRQSTAAVNTSGSRVVHRSRPFSYLGLLLSWSIASPSFGPIPVHRDPSSAPRSGRAPGALGWNASPPRETRSRLDRGPPIAWRVRFWPQCLGQWEMCSRRLIPCPRSATPPCLLSPLSQIRGLSWDTVTLCWPRTRRLDAPLRSRPRTCGPWSLGTSEPWKHAALAWNMRDTVVD